MCSWDQSSIHLLRRGWRWHGVYYSGSPTLPMSSDLFPPANRPPSTDAGQDRIRTPTEGTDHARTLRFVPQFRRNIVQYIFSIIGLRFGGGQERRHPTLRFFDSVIEDATSASKIKGSRLVTRAGEGNPFDLAARESNLSFCRYMTSLPLGSGLGGFRTPSGHPYPRLHTHTRLFHLIAT